MKFWKKVGRIVGTFLKYFLLFLAFVYALVAVLGLFGALDTVSFGERIAVFWGGLLLSGGSFALSMLAGKLRKACRAPEEITQAKEPVDTNAQAPVTIAAPETKAEPVASDDSKLAAQKPISMPSDTAAALVQAPAKPAVEAKQYLDALSYIKAVQYAEINGWYQYDILFDTTPYGWDYMLDSADYMATADLGHVAQLTVAGIDRIEKDYTDACLFCKHPCDCIRTDQTEWASLSIAGQSRALHHPVKIVWFNQTNCLRVFTLGSCHDRIRAYVETIVRRSFGTQDAMKEGKQLSDVL